MRAWAPGPWPYPEALVYLAAITVDGKAHNLGIMLGAVLVPGFGEATRFLPHLVDPQTSAAMEWIGASPLNRPTPLRVRCVHGR